MSGSGSSPSGAQPFFWVDCDRNNIDKISGLVAVMPYYAGSAQFNTAIYVIDPKNPDRYCLQKRSGNFFLPLFILSLPANMSESGNSFQLSSTTSQLFLALDNYQDNGNRLEFMVYVNNNNTNRSILSCGDLSSNSSLSGIEVSIFNSNLAIISRNFSNINTIENVGTVNSIANQWLTVQYDVKEISPSRSSCVVKIFDGGGNNIAYSNFLLIKPMFTNRWLNLFSEHYGYGAVNQNPYDYIKEVKMFREPDLIDFSFYG